jgi:hypothetical protein
MPDRTRSEAVPLAVSGWPTRTHSRWTLLGSGSLTTFVDSGRCRGGEAGLLSGLIPSDLRPASSTVQPTVQDRWLDLLGVVLAKRRSARQMSGTPMRLGRSQ